MPDHKFICFKNFLDEFVDRMKDKLISLFIYLFLNRAKFDELSLRSFSTSFYEEFIYIIIFVCSTIHNASYTDICL